MTEGLNHIFDPKNIALIGASAKPESAGYTLAFNLINGFKGQVFFVNLRKGKIFGQESFKYISEIAKPVDLAIIATPPPTVPGVMKECGQVGVKGIVIVSAGFKEAEQEDQQLSDSISKIVKAHGMRLIDTNSLGFIRPSTGLNATFIQIPAKKGKIAFISQSGGIGTAILDWARDQGVGFSFFVSIAFLFLFQNAPPWQ